MSGISLAVQWLGLHASIAWDLGLIRGWGTKILQAVWHGQKQKEVKIKHMSNPVTPFIRPPSLE